MFSNNLIAGAAGQSTGFYPLNIEQSLRFNDDDSAYLSRTPASAGNRKTWTWSGWVKRGDLSRTQGLFGAGVLGNNANFQAYWNSDNTLYFQETVQNVSNQLIWASTPIYRDVSAWYHVVIAMDTTQATAGNRTKVYVNGVQIAGAFSVTPTQNQATSINNNVAQYLGSAPTNTASLLYLDGYLAEVHFTDGTAYDADAFGEFKSGVWVAKSPSVTYGTNGFYLDFANSADIGNDVSGEGNDWTPNFFTASDVVLDSPTDNFCTWNPLQAVAVNAGAGIGAFNLSDGNLVSAEANSTNTVGYVCGTMGVSSGKWYWEVDCTSIGGTFGEIGIHRTSAAIVYSGSTDNDYRYRNDGTKQNGGTGSAYGASLSTGDVVGVALDLDAGTLTFYKNNVSQGTAFSGISGEFTPSVGDIQNASANTYTANFGQLGFTYTPPTGYLALSTANLPEPTISPADDASPSDYFNTVLYTGDGTTSKAITGVGFQPDFTWIKARNVSYRNTLQDTVRGAGKQMNSGYTDAEVDSGTNVGTSWFQSFDSDGFTVGKPNSGTYSGNEGTNGVYNYVAWNWKANGSGVSNTDGTITSTVSANTTSGFSIVSYVGNNGTPTTVGHGLSQKPELIIIKNRGNVDGGDRSWAVYHSAVGATKYLQLNTSGAAIDNADWWNDTEPTSSVFTIGASYDVNEDDGHIAYCFHSVEGFSKFGSYTGNGSADGPFVYTGFRPAFVMVKKSDGAENWIMIDSERSQYNIVNKQLLPNTSDSEGTISRCDFLSNGFKVRAASTAFNSGTMIYACFAETPFKFSNAR